MGNTNRKSQYTILLLLGIYFRLILPMLLILISLTYHISPANADLIPEGVQAEPLIPARDEVLDCANRLFSAAGRGGSHVPELVRVYRKASQDSENVEFMQYVLSIIYQESRFDRTALSSQDAYGLMQMTAGAVEAASLHCAIKPLPDIRKLHDSYTNLKYGTCYLKKLYTEMDGDWTRTLIAYNGGYKMLQRFDKGEMIANETANYVLLVHRALENICRNQGEN